ncbi:hypothetical protein EDB81DRAFT_948824 [Dactylonectria macrodidyma]|uniref:Uncharacterized protein n=1 Tax=Dactylonectria macrodidyma TaxID=307937 RepID=A0A9P9DB33_9HYPO|nr:hypothetical protein EDB81DRAFT_953117 [Dactylonectria macrodidyma]KAH7137562.1 hypothetical protein EDB81DRAFT_948824 [Dactylonectria macrodidyma]
MSDHTDQITVNPRDMVQDRPIVDERKALRRSCRALLAAHIKDSTGLTIEPENVRLVTKKSDGYSWMLHSSEDGYLFSKNLSEHSLSAYRALSSGVGERFYAVPFIDPTDMQLLLEEPQSSGPSSSPESSDDYVESGVPECKQQTVWQLSQQLQQEKVENERLQGALVLANNQCERLARRAERATLNDSLVFQLLASLNEIASIAERSRRECFDAMQFEDSYSPY